MKQFILTCFALALMVSLVWHSNYSIHPGMSGCVPENLEPVNSLADLNQAIARSKSLNSKTLILFYHPHCVCTRATVHNLQSVTAATNKHLNSIAIAYQPVISDPRWIHSSTSRDLKKAGFRVFADLDGKCCRELGVYTSGHVLVYDEQGKLVFNGGVTQSRGHEGSCNACDDLVKSIENADENIFVWPVFGCAILESEDQS